MIGPGVKFNRPEPCPSMKIQVKIPSVEPSPSALINAALMGRTSEPNVKNISKVVSRMTDTTISGRRSSNASTLSCSMAGVPPTSTVVPSGQSADRR